METDSYRFAVMGGDLRQWHLAKLLAQKGCRVTAYGMCVEESLLQAENASAPEDVMQADVFICPIPFLKNGKVSGTDVTFEMLQQHLKKGQFLFAGCIAKSECEKIEERGAAVFDFMKDSSTVLKNSVASAEGMIAEAIKRSPRNLRGSRCLVLGYGKCGRTLVSYLTGMGCHVKVYDKSREAMTYAKLNAVQMPEKEMFKAELEKADFIFNTVPDVLLKQEELSCVRKGVWILDMASAPGGVDYKEAERLGVSAVLLPGLPGRYAPLSSAEILADAILWRLKEFVV